MDRAAPPESTFARLIMGAAVVLFLALAACVPAKQYEQLNLTALDTGQSRSLTIHSQGDWRDTGVEVHEGEVYRVYTQGTWSAGGFCGPTDAEGLAVEHLACMKGIFAQNFPLPEGKIGALVGRIGPNGKAFVVGGTQGFIADADGTLFLRMNEPNDFIWDNEGEIEVAVQRFEEGVAPPGFGSTAGFETPGSRRSGRPRVAGKGFYAAERDIAFNVLERVEFDPATGELSLSGRFDPALAGPSIPYLQHLAEFLDSSGPQASLDWTPEFERRVDSFFRRMDDPNAMANLVGSGQLVDGDYNVTRKGRLYLPIFGVKPYDRGTAPGALGVQVSFKELGTLRVDSVSPGSAADRAGIVVGDEISFLEDGKVFKQPWIPATLNRYVRFAGEGAEIKVTLAGRQVNVTLDAYTGDPWEHVTKYDMLERIFRAADKPKAGQLMWAVGGLLRNQDNEAGEVSFINLLATTGAVDLFYSNRQKYWDGQMTQQQAFHEVARKVVRGMESAMELPYDSIVPVYDREYSRTGDPWGPIDVAILELNRRSEPFMKEALRTALYKNDQITMPVAILDDSQNFQPKVQPRYIGVPATSELARLFIEADYMGKAIIHRPDLSKRIPAYKTEYAFTGSSPGRVEETTNRLWITPGRVEVHRSPSENTLGFGRVQMAFNVGRAIGGGAEYRDQAYGRFLSGLYDDLAREFPSLHELREAAKLAVVAKWLKARQPGFTLPKEGRARLSPPSTLEGFVTLIWSPHSVKVTLIAPGGIDFNVPPIGPSGPVFPDPHTVNVPVNPDVVDLSYLSFDDAPRVDPEVFAPDSRSSIRPYYRRPLTEPPVPPSVRLVARATKGDRTLKRIDGIRVQTGRGIDACDAEKSRELNAKLTQAAAIARQLAGAEKALNVITAQAAQRQRTFDELAETFRDEQQRVRENIMDLGTWGLMGAYDELKGTVDVRSIRDLETLIATMRQAKDKLGYYGDQLANLDLAISSAMASSLAERERAQQSLLSYLKDLVGEGAKLKGNDAATRALRTAGKTLGVADKVLTAADTAASLYQLSAAVDRLQTEGEVTERELQGLKDSLLPLQRKLSNRLDEVMGDPLVRDYERGEGAFDCRG